jgi:ferredoxin-nitrite reductase
MSGDFTPEQKRYLEGFVSGVQARGGNGFLGSGSPPPAAPEPTPMGPDAPHLLAQDETIKAGKKLVDQEKWKREEHPFDAYHKLCGQAARDEPPKAADNFRWRFYGLFYVAPAQNSYMCRLRIPNGILSHWQFAGVAGLAEKFGGGYAHVTTRANLQFREVAPKDAIHVVEGVQDLGLTSRGAGADNIRNVTGDATAGIDPRALIDTRPDARAWHFHILNQRTLYGLPRKFNVAFDGGGAIPTLEDTNDIGFQAVEVEDGASVAPGVWFKLVVGGVTGHRDLARETGAVVKPGETAEVADAIVRVYIAEGDRTNRTKARLKYVLDRYAAEAGGLNGFLAKVEQQLGRPLARVDARHIRPRPAQDRQAHIGAHPQKQPGLFYLGVVLPVGKMSCAQICALAAIARDLGDGDIRLTVWQNLLISGASKLGLAENGFARVTTAHGNAVLRVNITAAQVPGRIFVPIHWNDETAGRARVGALVHAFTDPHSEQPDSKAVPAALAPVCFSAHGFVLARTRMPLPGDTAFAWTAIEGGYAARFGTNEPFTALIETFAAGSRAAEQASYNDPARGIFRTALILHDRLDAVLFLGGTEKCRRGAFLPRHGGWGGSTATRAAFFWRAGAHPPISMQAPQSARALA